MPTPISQIFPSPPYPAAHLSISLPPQGSNLSGCVLAVGQPHLFLLGNPSITLPISPLSVTKGSLCFNMVFLMSSVWFLVRCFQLCLAIISPSGVVAGLIVSAYLCLVWRMKGIVVHFSCHRNCVGFPVNMLICAQCQSYLKFFGALVVIKQGKVDGALISYRCDDW